MRRKLAGKKDWHLNPIILDGDWTFVTRNSGDFRGPAAKAGSRGVYADVAIHAGLVCLNGPEGLDLDMQLLGTAKLRLEWPVHIADTGQARSI